MGTTDELDTYYFPLGQTKLTICIEIAPPQRSVSLAAILLYEEAIEVQDTACYIHHRTGPRFPLTISWLLLYHLSFNKPNMHSYR